MSTTIHPENHMPYGQWLNFCLSLLFSNCMQSSIDLGDFTSYELFLEWNCYLNQEMAVYVEDWNHYVIIY